MFDADGNYSPPDGATRHVLVATDAFTGQLTAGFPIKIAKGQVLQVAMLGQTNVQVGHGPQHPRGTLVEHPTAQIGDILTDADMAVRIGTARAKQAAVAKFRDAEAAKPAAPPSLTVGGVTLTESDVAALKAMLDPKPAAAG
jgi:hypothetical protein